VRMRMADACALLNNETGTRVHRSWQEARGAIKSSARWDGKVELTLAKTPSIPFRCLIQPCLRKQG